MAQSKSKKIDYSGNVRCLGWCNKKFFSKDRRKQRFCPKCRSKKDDKQIKASGIPTFNFEDAFNAFLFIASASCWL